MPTTVPFKALTSYLCSFLNMTLFRSFNKRKAIFLLIISLPSLSAHADTFHWTSTSSNSWNSGSNWSGGNFTHTWPSSSSDIVYIDGGSVPCTLDLNRIVARLYISNNKSLNLNGRTLTVSGFTSINDAGTVWGGEISSASIIQVTMTTFSSPMTLRVTSGGSNNWSGGNTFNGTRIIQQSFTSINMALTTGDTFNANTYLEAPSSGSITLGSSGTNYINGQLFLNNPQYNSTFNIGNTNSTVYLGSSTVIGTSTGFSDCTLNLKGVIQNNTLAHIPLSLLQFSCINSTIRGNLDVTCSLAMTLTSSTLSATNSLSSPSIILDGCAFSTSSGNTTLHRNALASFNTNNDWYGGNTFGGDLLVRNSQPAGHDISMSAFGSAGDTFLGTAHFLCDGGSNINVGERYDQFFHGDIFLNALPGTSITFGSGFTGDILLEPGVILRDNGMVGASLTLVDLISASADIHDSFSLKDLTINYGEIQGGMEFIASGVISLYFADFQGDLSLSAPNINLQAANHLSTVSGSTTIVRLDHPTALDDTWGSANEFGPVIITNQDNDTKLVTASDTYLSDAQFIRTGLGEMWIGQGSSSFYGDIYTFGSTGPVNFSPVSGTTTFAGSPSQAFASPSGITNTIGHLVMSTSGSSYLELQSPILVEREMTLFNGRIDTDSYALLTLADQAAASVGIGSVNSYVNGPLASQLSTTTHTLLNLPIGRNGSYHPAALTVKHTSTVPYVYVAEVKNQSAKDLGWSLPLTVQGVSDVRYWDISRYEIASMTLSPTTGLDVSPAYRPQIRLYYDLSDGVTDPTFLCIVKNSPSSPTSWTDIGGSGASMGAGSVISTSLPSPFNSFSRFTLGNMNGGVNPLPIALLHFNARSKGDDVEVEWSTATELNNDFFLIDRSLDGSEWETLAQINGAGNSSARLDYSFLDINPMHGLSYYRLRQVDYNGHSETFDPVALYFEHTEPDVTWNFFPNPVHDKIEVRHSSLKELEFKIYDLNGMDLSEQMNQPHNSINRYILDMSTLTPGLYILSSGTESKLLQKL